MRNVSFFEITLKESDHRTVIFHNNKLISLLPSCTVFLD